MSYTAPFWLPDGHSQTIYPALFIRKPEVDYRRERWTTPDQDFIDVDFVDGEVGKPLLVLFHGLEGSSNSHYARALMAHIKTLGWSGVVPHFRACSGEMNLAPRFYHSGDAQEIDWILHRIHSERRENIGALYVCGVSLGGNALLRWLGESQQQAQFVTAACAVSAPLNLTQSGATLSHNQNWMYTQKFLRTLKPKCLEKLKQFPKLFDREKMLAAKNLHQFDNIVTAPLHGYRDVEDYWHRASACLVLDDIRVPTLVLNAKNDPFLPARYLPLSASEHVHLTYPEQGGHVGFAHGKFPGRLQWLPQQLVQFLIRYG